MGAFKVRALVVSMGGVQFGADVKLSRGAANRLDLASGDTFNIQAGSYLNASDGVIQVHHGTYPLGTTVASTVGLVDRTYNGAVYTGYKSGSAQLGFVINGTAVVFSVPIAGEGGALVCTVNPAGT